MSRVNDWIMDMDMFVEEAIWESGLRDVEEIVEDVEKHMKTTHIDRRYVRAQAKNALEAMA